MTSQRILCIGQSDSCAGTGIQADIKTAQAFGVYAATVVTAVCAQNTQGVQEIHPVPQEIVRAQIHAVAEDIAPTVIKTGMLVNESVINAVGDYLDEIQNTDVRVVIDPVMTSRSGRILLDKPAKDALKRRLLVRAEVLTPNLHEAEDLTGLTIRDLDGMMHAAEMLKTLGARNVILKGGGLADAEVYDVISDARGVEVYATPRLPGKATHGAGTTLSAGIAAGLAQGMEVWDAFIRAREYLNRAIAAGGDIGRGFAPVHHGVSLEGLPSSVARS